MSSTLTFVHLDEGAPVDLGSTEDYLKLGSYPSEATVFFNGADRPLAAKIAKLVADHRAELRAANQPADLVNWPDLMAAEEERDTHADPL